MRLLATLSSRELRVSWYNDVMARAEILAALASDGRVALGGMVLVVCCVGVVTRSALLTVGACLCVVLSLPIAYWAYGAVFQLDRMPLLNFFGLFVVIGVGCDGIFLLFNTFNEVHRPRGRERGEAAESLATETDGGGGAGEGSSRRHVLEIEGPEGARGGEGGEGGGCLCLQCCGGPSREAVERLATVYARAGSALLAASVSTAASFFANAASALPVLREFGVFVGLLVLVNYSLVMTLFVAALVIRARLGRGSEACALACVQCCGRGLGREPASSEGQSRSGESQTPFAATARDSLPEGAREGALARLARGGVYWWAAARPNAAAALVSLAVAAVFVRAALVAEPSSRPPVLLGPEENLGVAQELWSLVGDMDLGATGSSFVVPSGLTDSTGFGDGDDNGGGSDGFTPWPTLPPTSRPSHGPTPAPTSGAGHPTAAPSPAPTVAATPAPTEAAVRSAVTVDLLWDLRGVQRRRRGPRRESDGDEGGDGGEGKASGFPTHLQELALATCRAAASDLSLGVVRRASVCFPDAMDAWLRSSTGRSLPLAPELFSGAAAAFIYGSGLEAFARPNCVSGDLDWMRATFRTRLPVSLPPGELLRFFAKWDAFAKDQTRIYAAAGLGNATAWSSSSSSSSSSQQEHDPFVGPLTVVAASWPWVRATTEARIISSAAQAFGISLGSAAACVLCFTRKLGTTLAACACILVVNLLLLSLMVLALGWTLGAVEAVSITVFVGFSVDYILHIAHAYASSAHHSAAAATPATGAASTAPVEATETTAETTAEASAAAAANAVAATAPSIAGATLTTGVAAVALMLCKIQIFVKMGATLLACTLLSASVALFVLPGFLLALANNDANPSSRKAAATAGAETAAAAVALEAARGPAVAVVTPAVATSCFPRGPLQDPPVAPPSGPTAAPWGSPSPSPAHSQRPSSSSSSSSSSSPPSSSILAASSHQVPQSYALSPARKPGRSWAPLGSRASERGPSVDRAPFMLPSCRNGDRDVQDRVRAAASIDRPLDRCGRGGPCPASGVVPRPLPRLFVAARGSAKGGGLAVNPPAQRRNAGKESFSPRVARPAAGARSSSSRSPVAAVDGRTGADPALTAAKDFAAAELAHGKDAARRRELRAADAHFTAAIEALRLEALRQGALRSEARGDTSSGGVSGSDNDRVCGGIVMSSTAGSDADLGKALYFRASVRRKQGRLDDAVDGCVNRLG